MMILRALVVISFIHLVQPQTSSGDAGVPELEGMLSSFLDAPSEQRNQTMEILKMMWSELSPYLNKTVGAGSGMSQECTFALKYIAQNFTILKLYLDASPRIPQGMVFGNTLVHGAYGECVLIKGKYCSVNNVAVIGKPISLGLCVPAQCSASDVQEMLNFIAQSTNNTIISLYDNKDVWKMYHAYTLCGPEPNKYSVGSILMIVVLSLIGLLCLLGTSIDFYQEYVMEKLREAQGYADLEPKLDGVATKMETEEVQPQGDGAISLRIVSSDKLTHPVLSFLLCFSILRNTRAVLDTNVPCGAITSINGIRTLSMSWVILGHIFAFMNTLFNTDNYLEFAANYATKWTFQGILNATVSVDSFFLLSGLLVSYLSLKRYFTSGSLPLLRYYLHRYIRLTPSLLIVMLFAMYVYPLLGSGPFWFGIQRGAFTRPCDSHWWSNLLYINNLYPNDMSQECIGWVWYLANDMQFYVISPIILYLMYKFKGVAVVVVNGFLVAVAVISTGALIGADNLQIAIQLNGQQQPKDKANISMNWIYVKPWTRIGPYAVGLVLGYVLITKKKFVGSRRHVYVLTGWALAIGTALAIIYGPYSSKHHVWNNAEQVLYGMSFRTLWGCCLAWLIFACHTGYGGVVNRILSWKAWIPLSRLTYGTYLVHPLVIFYLYATVQAPMHFTMVEAVLLGFNCFLLMSFPRVFHFLGSAFLSYMCAFILSVTVEYPVFNLEKLYLKF